jgi:hypothetical protein
MAPVVREGARLIGSRVAERKEQSLKDQADLGSNSDFATD